MNTEKWYAKSYRRNLVDMHIDDWAPEFLSEFSVEEYYQNLVTGNIDAAMIYLQSHTGKCFWPTKTGHMHSALRGREDLIRRLAEKCRGGGIRVIGYYSLIFNTWAEQAHPEWRLIKENGKTEFEEGSRYGLCCPNNPEYRRFVEAQIREMSEYFEVDGMFYDMTFWPHVCHCGHCKKRQLDESGKAIPKEDWTDPVWLDFINRRQQWIAEFAAFVTNTTKNLFGDIPVEHNYAGVIACGWVGGTTELINDVCDYSGGDLYGDLFDHSFTCKYYMEITKNKPFEYMTCRVDYRLYQHTVTKDEADLEREIMLTAAHHGASLIIDAIDPKGTLDGRVYQRIGNIFEKQRALEPYFGGELYAEAGVFFDTTAKHDDQMKKASPKAVPYRENSNTMCAVNAVKTLAQSHIPVGVVSNGCLNKLQKYKAVIAPDADAFCDGALDAIFGYVQSGGSLYLSGALNNPKLREFMGVQMPGYTAHNETYIAPKAAYERLFDGFNAAYPMHTWYRQPIISGFDDSETLACAALPYTLPDERRYASIHSNPPGVLTQHPSVIFKRIGKGKVLWSGVPLENDTRKGYKRVFLNLLKAYLLTEKSKVETDADPATEIVIMQNDNFLTVSFVGMDQNIRFGGIKSFQLTLDKKPKSVISLTTGKSVGFEYRDNAVIFGVPDFAGFEMIKIER
jgi:hypothetical protein